jgi:hypothetical protein
MATPDIATCLPPGADRSELLPLSPFNALYYHFGMLLGEDDFNTEQGYHRAKMRIHNAWLHREGVVWGFAVTVDQEHGEIHVAPGLALDAAGHELHLEAEACLNVAEWFEKHKGDADFTIQTTTNGNKTFDARVVIRFKACLTRQVPALMEPCNNAGTSTAYSRVFETVEILLLPNLAPPPIVPYHRLRLLFGITPPIPKDNPSPEDQAVLDEVTRIRALSAADQPGELLKAFHRFAALDEIDLKPATGEDGASILLFPGREDEPVLLADIAGITLQQNNNSWKLSGGAVDPSVRTSHVATTTIQDLLCGRLRIAPGAEGDDSGPRIDPASVIFLTSTAVMFVADKELQDASVNPAAFSVTWFDEAKGWQRSNVITASYGGGETRTVKLDLDSAVSGRVRLVVFGTGATPLLGADLVPLAGAVGGPPGTADAGNDFVYMRDFISTPHELADPEPTEGADNDSLVTAALRRLKPKRKTTSK